MTRIAFVGVVLLAGLTWLAAGAVPAAAQEFQSNRRGSDYKNFWLPRPDYRLCRNACAREGRCRAWTYVRPGKQGRQAKCWLKHGVPRRTADNCCISGVKGGIGGPPPRVHGYYARWLKVAGPGRPWASKWAWYGPQFMRRYRRPVCGHGHNCNCGGRNFCKTGYVAGQRVLFWPQGCDRPSWTLVCQIRRR